MSKKRPSPGKSVETLSHDEAKRKNIPTAEYQSVLQKEEQNPVRVAYPRGAAGLEEEKARRNRDLDPQLAWRGKDEQDWSDLVVHAPPLYIQEKVHPKVLIDELQRHSEQHPSPLEGEGPGERGQQQLDLFADFNGIPQDIDKAPRPTSPNNGAAAGSRSTPRASRWHWPAPASWARAIRITCSPIRATASSRKPRSPAPRHRPSRYAGISVRGLRPAPGLRTRASA